MQNANDANLYKKIAPLVPPKPLKKQQQNMPEVPHSMQVKQICEPRYSQRLQQQQQADAAGASMSQLLQRKQPIYAAAQHASYGMANVTLDNPDVLDQQLEALAYHKKQLDKKKLLQQQTPASPASACIPKLSSTSLISEPKKKLAAAAAVDEPTYSNVLALANNFNLLALAERPPAQNGLELYGAGKQSTAVEKHAKTQPAASLHYFEPNNYYKQQQQQQHEEEDALPPPPSPVSSSYSELRRANDKQTIAQHQHQQQQQQQQENGANESMSCYEFLQQPAQKQTYLNLNYSQDSLNYSPTTLQHFSKDTADYYCFGGNSSQGSLTYESIYEPINPRPSSQLSSLQSSSYLALEQLDSANSIDSKQASVNGSMLGIAENAINQKDLNMQHQQQQQENEVEALTEFLVHSMDTQTDDIDNYGICFKCQKRVLGENSGCTAMDQVYHIVCFTCTQCQINLQGKPFYALEGKPYCEQDYLQTLEKCSVCMKPILERILRATGKPYHPQCFQCIVCGKSLDGIPFTVDATNQNYCIADFHKKFAPRCCVCKEPIMPDPGEDETVRVVALDRSFHFECYKCEDCGLLLSSEAEGRGCYPLDDHVLCKSCNAKRVQMLTSNMTTEL